MLTIRTLVIGALMIAGAAAFRPAEAQSGRVTTSSSLSGGPAMGMNPYTNPYLNPYANPYLYNAPRGGVGAAMVFLSAQQAQARAAQQRAEIARERESPRVGPRSPMGVPGGGAARYFGGNLGPVGPMGRDGDARFQGQSRYFRPNG